MTKNSKDIKNRKKIISNGNYKKAFSLEENYQSSVYTSEFIRLLWKCYSVWGQIKINGIFIKDISEDHRDLGNYKLITAKMGDFTIKSKVNRETEIPSQNVKLHIPAEKCCVYENNKLI